MSKIINSKPTTTSTLDNVTGFDRQRNTILFGFVILTVVYIITYKLVEWNASSTTTIFTPAPQFCPDYDEGLNKEPCSRPDLFAFQVAGFIMQVYMGVSGLLAWHITKRAHTLKTPESRIYGYLIDAERLNAAIFIYQTWDFFFSLPIPEHATIVFLGHHLAAAILAYYSLQYDIAHKYAIFFGGCSEISSIFLVFCDFDVYFPSSRGSIWGNFIFFCQVSFTLLFIAYRVVGWWWVSYNLWKDAIHVRPKAETYRPGKGWFLDLFLFLDIALGILQLYWFLFGMVPKIAEILADDT